MNSITVLEIKFDYNGANNSIFPVILSDNEEMILIDCGYPGFLPLIKDCADKEGVDLRKLTKIIITHHDFDHMGALAEFKRQYPNVKVMASIEDEKYISGKEKSLRLKQAEAIFEELPEEGKEEASKFNKMLEAIENVEVDICLKDKDSYPWCGGAEIIATPGHMPGHISIYLKESKTLISGDAVVIEGEDLAIANPQYTLDMEATKASIKKLLTYEIDKIICYHGGIFTKDIERKLQKLCNYQK